MSSLTSALPRAPRARTLAVAVCLVLAAASCGGGGDDEATTGTERATTTSTSTTTTAPKPTTTTSTTTTTAPPTTTTVPPTTTAPPTTAPPTTQPPPPPPPPPAPPTPDQVVCIGDSVMLGAGPQYQNALGVCGTVDAQESRQFSTAPGLVAQYLGASPQRVVLGLGTNGSVTPGDADAVLSSLAGVPKVLLVNVQLNGSRPWEGPVNDALAAAASRFPNVTLVDWKGVSDGHPEYFAGDGIHMAAAGAQVYGFLIAASL